MRKDSDFLGEVEIEDSVYYGVQTLRATQNFAVSGVSHYEMQNYIKSVALIKKAAALANHTCGALSAKICEAICKASDEVIDGKFANSFPIDVFQGGGGTSTNMNLNEVIACRANEILTGEKSYSVIHPNTHVNMGQSTNDVIPAAMKMTAYKNLETLLKSVKYFTKILTDKKDEYADVLRLGRTCLQDAVPMTFGQYFGGYVGFMKRMEDKIHILMDECLELPLGATAIGTSLSVNDGYLDEIYEKLYEISGVKFRSETNFFDGLANADFYISLSATLKRIATTLSKMATDFRILSSGPRAGINELTIPAVQPGSSIMPGKVNPVMPELINQIGYQICGNDMAITMAVEGGELDLNVWEPVIIKNLCESFKLLENGLVLFADKCVKDLAPNIEICKAYASNSTALSTTISSIFGYKVGTKVARKAFDENKSVKDVVLELGILNKEQADEVLDPMVMISPKRSSAVIKKYKEIYKN
ncbi:aspartate ammonia-lyase [Campylobacter hyointestinalis]|uniref:aspartate ammonia-lyase n=3 Tax=Campylobacter hyointestinalis TaxID=198 RepID=UPI000CE37100|nr:aspartate ammonia-lyase [Campylobacter hyointestinalis]PPB72758.1 aspartate ammonia-lyase [Campylobacter hyointestinalis subsp. hyointestinalis]PPB74889.1 aspartate ammonia-lyase [Campylobacter hyointestinalis subsp. hyointestinalis]PPB76801.1 aspartate ammonia-lyase [Campylobacter hyointestinalis subsp. hyointestinalis]PPB77294.1 aspartate ammonia-lyase [Campylobacter hyointestinalis subsp. hyointestinalis]